jgi:hypothetical protein
MNEFQRQQRTKTKVKVKFFIKILHAISATMRIPIAVVFIYPPPSPCLYNCEKRLLASSGTSVSPSVHLSVLNNSALPGWSLMKFYIWEFFENLPRKSNFHYNLTRIVDTLHEDQYTFFIISRLVLLRMKNISNKCYRENQTTYFIFGIFFLENHAIYEIMWTGHRWQYGACSTHAGCLRLQIPTQNM